jgi:hypothetical protein
MIGLYQTLLHARLNRPKPPLKSKRKRLSMRPEKRPQTIMEQYRHRELMSQEHNKKVWQQLIMEHQLAMWALESEAKYGPSSLARGL